MEMPSEPEPSAGPSSSSSPTAHGPGPGPQQNPQLIWHTQSQVHDLQNIQNDFIDSLIDSLMRLADGARLVKHDRLTAVESGREPDSGAFSNIMDPVRLTKSIIHCILVHLEQMPERYDGASERYGPYRASVPPYGLGESKTVVLGSEEQEEIESEADDDKENVLQSTNYNMVDKKYGDYYLYGEETAPSSSLTLDNMEIQMPPSSQEAEREHIEEDAKQDEAASTPSSTATIQSLTAIEYTEHPQKQDSDHRNHNTLSNTAVTPFNNEELPSSPRHEGSSTPQNNRANKGKQTSPKTDYKNDKNHVALHDNDLRRLNESTDMLIFWSSIRHLSSEGLRRMAQLLPAMNRLGHGDWTNGEERFVSAMHRNGAPQLESWTVLYQTQLEARREMGYFGDIADNMTGKAQRNLPRFAMDM